MGQINCETWLGCYRNGWQGLIVPESFCHPAKFSRGLINRIYEHALQEKLVKRGDTVIDPFGGVALGALNAMIYGINWIGVEVEEKFVKLGKENIELWKRKTPGIPLGEALIIQGDSRRIGRVVKEAGLIVSSPPYFKSLGSQDVKFRSEGLAMGAGKWAHRRSEKSIKNLTSDYGSSPGQLGSMKDGDFAAIVSSPPYERSVHDPGNRNWDYSKGRIPAQVKQGGYGSSPGQLGSMKDGDFAAIVSSPPYEDSLNSKAHGIDWSKAGPATGNRKRGNGTKHEKTLVSQMSYSGSMNNLGMKSGETFWTASREIVQGCYDLLTPGGHAIWVCKDFIRERKIVPFSDRWLALCESVGFRLVCRHYAMLVEKHGSRTSLMGDEEEIRTERKSFFRRLAESRGSPRIDHENVICMKK